MEKPNIKIENLVVGYGQKHKPTFATKMPQIQFKTGQLIAIIGANGCGKSTFLRTLLNMHSPISGNILLNEKSIFNLDYIELAKWQSVVLTEKLPPSNLTCEEIVAMGRMPYTPWHGYLNEIDRQLVNQMILDLDLENLRYKTHDELSDGQLQRTLIARALAQDTPFIILDEPTTHLDLSHQFKLFDILKNLAHKQNKCVIFSTHAIELAVDHCDFILAFTPENNYYNTPKNLITSKVFDELFEDKNMRYDVVKNKFFAFKQF